VLADRDRLLVLRERLLPEPLRPPELPRELELLRALEELRLPPLELVLPELDLLDPPLLGCAIAASFGLGLVAIGLTLPFDGHQGATHRASIASRRHREE
jgi:hypothetical protein